MAPYQQQTLEWLQAELRLSNDREAVLAEKLGRSRAEVAELTNRLQKAQEAYRSARRSAREALTDMAEENAKLVAAFVQKRKEVKMLQASGKEDREMWAARLQNMEQELNSTKQQIRALMEQMATMNRRHSGSGGSHAHRHHGQAVSADEGQANVLGDATNRQQPPAQLHGPSALPPPAAAAAAFAQQLKQPAAPQPPLQQPQEQRRPPAGPQQQPQPQQPPAAEPRRRTQPPGWTQPPAAAAAFVDPAAASQPEPMELGTPVPPPLVRRGAAATPAPSPMSIDYYCRSTAARAAAGAATPGSGDEADSKLREPELPFQPPAAPAAAAAAAAVAAPVPQAGQQQGAQEPTREQGEQLVPPGGVGAADSDAGQAPRDRDALEHRRQVQGDQQQQQQQQQLHSLQRQQQQGSTKAWPPHLMQGSSRGRSSAAAVAAAAAAVLRPAKPGASVGANAGQDVMDPDVRQQPDQQGTPGRSRRGPNVGQGTALVPDPAAAGSQRPHAAAPEAAAHDQGLAAESAAHTASADTPPAATAAGGGPPRPAGSIGYNATSLGQAAARFAALAERFNARSRLLGLSPVAAPAPAGSHRTAAAAAGAAGATTYMSTAAAPPPSAATEATAAATVPRSTSIAAPAAAATAGPPPSHARAAATMSDGATGTPATSEVADAAQAPQRAATTAAAAAAPPQGVAPEQQPEPAAQRNRSSSSSSGVGRTAGAAAASGSQQPSSASGDLSKEPAAAAHLPTSSAPTAAAPPSGDREGRGWAVHQQPKDGQSDSTTTAAPAPAIVSSMSAAAGAAASEAVGSRRPVGGAAPAPTSLEELLKRFDTRAARRQVQPPAAATAAATTAEPTAPLQQLQHTAPAQNHADGSGAAEEDPLAAEAAEPAAPAAEGSGRRYSRPPSAGGPEKGQVASGAADADVPPHQQPAPVPVVGASSNAGSAAPAPAAGMEAGAASLGQQRDRVPSPVQPPRAERCAPAAASSQPDHVPLWAPTVDWADPQAPTWDTAAAAATASHPAHPAGASSPTTSSNSSCSSASTADMCFVAAGIPAAGEGIHASSSSSAEEAAIPTSSRQAHRSTHSSKGQHYARHAPAAETASAATVPAPEASISGTTQRAADGASMQEQQQQQPPAAVEGRPQDVQQQAEALKQQGNRAYQAGQYRQAQLVYTRALELAAALPTLQAVLYCNRAAALHCQGCYLEAIVDCCMASHLDDSLPRILQRRADAYTAIHDHGSAVRDLEALCGRPDCPPGAPAKLQQARQELALWGSAATDHYKVLGLKQQASAADIKGAYRQLALRFHPDKARGQAQQAAADVAFKLVTAAYAILSSPQKRAAYDANRQLQPLRGYGQPQHHHSSTGSSSRTGVHPFYGNSGPSFSSSSSGSSSWASFSGQQAFYRQQGSRRM